LKHLLLLSLLVALLGCAGKPAPISASDVQGYAEKGIASWYGRKYHGRLTANGENGKKVRVRINDRGPFKKGRIIDLSYAAARELGMVEQGLARVKIKVVGQQ